MLNEQLRDLSGSRRGVIFLPEEGKTEPTVFANTFHPHRLLVEGDHGPSLAFVNQFIEVPEDNEPREEGA